MKTFVTVLNMLLVSLVQISVVQAETLSCSVTGNGCDQILSPSGNGLVIKNKQLAGQTVCIAPGTYDWLYLENVHGEHDNPVTITNCDGQVVIDGRGISSSGIGVIGSKYVRITGTGDDSTKYGFRIKRPRVHGVDANAGTSDIEIDHLELSEGYSGISVRSYPRCDGSFARHNWSMNNVSVHNNYVHGVRGEGLYIGPSHFHQDPSPICPDLTLREAEIRNIHIYNNQTEDTGRDGIQIGAGVEGVRVHNNSIKRYALAQSYGHVSGFQINPGTVGEFYNNWVEAAENIENSVAIQYAGGDSGDLNIYNNVIVGAPTVFLSLARMAAPIHTIRIVNNTIVNSGILFHFICSVESAENYEIKNNLFAGYNSIGVNYWQDWQKLVGNDHKQNCLINGQIFDSTNDPMDYHLTSNTYLPQIESAKFANADEKDFRLTAQSPAINNGEDYSSLVDTDIEGNTRSDNSLDNGAYVFNEPAVYKVDFQGTSLDGWQRYDVAYHDDSVTFIENETGRQQIGLAITSHFCGAKQTPYAVDSGIPDIIPDQIFESFWYTCADKVGEITVTGLKPNAKYKLTLIGSRLTNDERVTQYTIAEQTQTVTASNNDANTAMFGNLVTQTGAFKLQVSTFNNGTGNQYGYINGMIIEEQP